VKAISSIVATALILVMTIVGGVLLYTYAMGYLNTLNTGRIIVHDAYYLKTASRIYINVENIGVGEVEIKRVEIVDVNGNIVVNTTINTILQPGESRIIQVNWTQPTLPKYIIVVYDKGSTDPVKIRVLS